MTKLFCQGRLKSPLVTKGPDFLGMTGTANIIELEFCPVLLLPLLTLHPRSSGENAAGSLPCLTRPVSSHRGKLLERQALLLWPWTPIGTLTNTHAAKRNLLGAETQPLHSRSSCQGPGVILWPVLEDPDPNVPSGAHTHFSVCEDQVCKLWGSRRQSSKSISSLAASKPEKPQTVGLGGTVGATSALQTGLAPALTQEPPERDCTIQKVSSRVVCALSALIALGSLLWDFIPALYPCEITREEA